MKNISMLLTVAILRMSFVVQGQNTPKIGEYAYCYLTVRYDDSLMFSSYKKGDTVKIMLKAPDSLKPDILNATLLKLGVGDSTTIEQLVDTMQHKPVQLAHVKKIVYGVRLITIQSEEQHKANEARKESILNSKKELITKALQKLKTDSLVIRSRANAIADSMKTLAKSYTDGKLKDKIKTTPSGLKYIVLKEGVGSNAKSGNVAAMHYYGVLTNGESFDNSYSRGDCFPAQVGVGQVILGWDEGMQLMKKGMILLLIVPPQLGYGDNEMPGRKGKSGIPAHSELLFYMEMMNHFDYQ
jgi:FKBP-type peptidyl-prolyl cis-trans isomerase